MSNVQLITSIVSSTDHETLGKARKKAVAIFGIDRVTESLSGSVGLNKTFIVTPSGSKTDWEEDVAHKAQISEFIEYLDSWAYSENKGDNSLIYVIVSYGDYGAQIYTTNQIDRVNS